MPDYAAFLRGVMPTNAKMPELKKCFEAAGFADVKTVLSSGNIVFRARKASESSLERKCEAIMDNHLGRAFLTLVRPIDTLRAILERDPYQAFRVPPAAKRIVTFLREKPKSKVVLPIERDGARILHIEDREVFSAYLPTPRGPVFMTLIQKAFGEEVTTRTWETVKKVVATYD
jgi:uncharacterized protein (DUF1697 family)